MIVLEILGWAVGGVVGLLFLFLLFTCFCSLFINPKKKYEKDSPFFRGLYEIWIVIVMIVCRVKVVTKGFEMIPEGRYLIVANHCSNFDPLVIYRVLPKRQLAFVSKESNLKIPFFGRIAWRCGCLPINREDPREALRTINEAVARMKDDSFSYGIYPEGTRNRTDATLLPFRPGAFKIAQYAGTPIVVMVEKHTKDVVKNWPFRRTVIELEVLEVISKEEAVKAHSVEISARVEQELRESLENEKNADSPEAVKNLSTNDNPPTGEPNED